MSDDANNNVDESINNEDPINIVYQIPVWLFSIWVVLPSLAIVSVVMSWIFIYTYRTKPIVAMAQPEFIYSVCAGAILIASHMLFYIPVAAFNNSDIAITPPGLNVWCNLTIWCTYVGSILVNSALLCKIYRMKLITDQPLRRGLMILPKHVIGPYITLIIITISILVAWTAVQPDKFETIKSDPNTNISMGICSFGTSTDSNTIDIVVFDTMEGLKSIVVIILLILAWRIRHVNQELSDSNRIFRLMFYLMIIQIIYVALYQTIILWKIQPSLAYSIRILLNIIDSFLTSMGIIGFLIMPRIYYVWYEHKHGHLPENVHMIGGGRTTVRGVNPVSNGNGNGNGTDVTTPRISRNNDNNNNNIKNDYNGDNEVNNNSKVMLTAISTTIRSSTME